MKYLIWLLVVLVAVWAFKRSRKAKDASASPAKPSKRPSNMVSCAHCGLHLPQDEAVIGEKDVYCSTEHRTAAEDRNPA
ncbi:MAG: PP0621 family protein [Burkholderiales bacterium]|jgi:uncharacterized protein|uniref:PP0621 family protein n=1 Tax=Limnohabitans sp. TaxID=1907725 RepID=UPI0025F651D5|nr:PP0621 family protein [Limnohabitans sp.]